MFKNISAYTTATCVYILFLYKILHARLPQERLSMGTVLLVDISQMLSQKRLHIFEGMSVVTYRNCIEYCVSSLAPIFEVRTTTMLLLVILGNYNYSFRMASNVIHLRKRLNWLKSSNSGHASENPHTFSRAYTFHKKVGRNIYNSTIQTFVDASVRVV